MTRNKEHTKSCIAPNVGVLLMQYELGRLSADERSDFERHLMDCDFCFEEARGMRGIADALLANRKEIIEAFEKEGITLDSLLDQTSERSTSAVVKQDSAKSKGPVFSWKQVSNKHTGILTLAAALLVAIGLTVFDGGTPIAIDSYAPPSWLEWRTRGTETIDSLLVRAQKSYTEKDFFAAVSLLSHYLTDHADPQYMLYLGVAQYEIQQFDLAEQTLINVKSNNSVLISEAKFYHALVMLKQGRSKEALPILKQLVADNSSRVEEARELIQRLGGNIE